MSTLPHPRELLPHGPAMMLLDEVLQLGADGAQCRVHIRPQSPFFEPGRGVPNWVGIEYMAQTIGVHAGHLRLSRGLQIEIGLLLGTRTLDFGRDWFAEGEIVDVRARLEVLDGEGVGAYDCALYSGGELCARALIKAYQPDNIREYLSRIYANDTGDAGQ